jgi:hypothetical protein
MIDRRTVFVLGAGASVPYGFPVGSELVDRVCEHLGEFGPDAEWRTRLRETAILAGTDVNRDSHDIDFDSFGRRLRDSRLNSIDLFVERNPQYATLGKRAIAQELILCEDDLKLTAAPPAHDWHRYLFNQLFPAKLADYRCHLRVITFNFDRSFERALFLAARAIYPDASSDELRSLVPVLHMHGQLGEPAWWEAKPSATTRTYTSKLTAERVFESAKQLLMVHDELTDGGVIETSRQWLEWAQCVCFLGLAFHDLNLDRLDVPSSLKTKTVHCTRYMMGDGPVGRARGRFRMPMARWCERSWDIVRFLDETDVVHANGKKPRSTGNSQ